MEPSSLIKNSIRKLIMLLGGLLPAVIGLAQERVGEQWTAVRGDNSPGAAYSTFVETPSGRCLAAGQGGQLMLSDNDGDDWRYSVITNSNGRPLFCNTSDMVVPTSALDRFVFRMNRQRAVSATILR